VTYDHPYLRQWLEVLKRPSSIALPGRSMPDAVETDSLDVAACVPEDIVIILSVKN
jgi:hypothetical protein